MTLGQRIKELREEKELTQEELGKLISISKASLSKYEADIIQPNNETIVFLANFFNVSTDYLLCRTNVRESVTSMEQFTNNLLDSDFARKYVGLTDEQRKVLDTLVETWQNEDKK